MPLQRGSRVKANVTFGENDEHTLTNVERFLDTL